LQNALKKTASKAVVHNLFRPRATKQFLKPFGGQAGVTTQLMSDECLQMCRMCPVRHKVNTKSYTEMHS